MRKIISVILMALMSMKILQHFRLENTFTMNYEEFPLNELVICCLLIVNGVWLRDLEHGHAV